MVLSSRRPPSLVRVPASLVPRSQRYYEGATTSHLRISGHLFCSLPPPTRSLLLCVRRGAPGGTEVPSRPGLWVPAARISGFCVWTQMGSLRSPGDPSCAFAPLLDPGRTDVPLPWRSHRYCPRFKHSKGFGDANFGAHSRSFSTCSPTLRVSRCHSRARLASGWLAGLYREGVEPSGSLRKVSDYMIIPLSCPPDASSILFHFEVPGG
jgi:hypothetical protein